MIAKLLKPSLIPLAGLASFGALAAAVPGLFLVNESPSLPTGLYMRAPDASLRRGAVVAVEPPPVARAYLTGLGMPASTKLLKRVAATQGMAICRQDNSVHLQGRLVRIQSRDRRGVLLPQWRGCRALGIGELFVLGDAPTSFDSRYFGPVASSAVRGVYREVLRW